MFDLMEPQASIGSLTETIEKMIEGIQSASKTANSLRSKSKPRDQNPQNSPPSEKSKLWSARETTLFYRLISKYGTDFNIIKEFLPRKTKTQVKVSMPLKQKKFKEEEALRPDRLHQALKGGGVPNELDKEIERLLQETSDSS